MVIKITGLTFLSAFTIVAQLLFGAVAGYALGFFYFVSAIFCMNESKRIITEYDYGDSARWLYVACVFFAAATAAIPLGWVVSAICLVVFTGVAAHAAWNDVKRTKANFVKLWVITTLPLSGMIVADYLMDLNRQYLVAVITTFAGAFFASTLEHLWPIQQKNQTKVTKRATFSGRKNGDAVNGC